MHYFKPKFCVKQKKKKKIVLHNKAQFWAISYSKTHYVHCIAYGPNAFSWACSISFPHSVTDRCAAHAACPPHLFSVCSFMVTFQTTVGMVLYASIRNAEKLVIKVRVMFTCLSWMWQLSLHVCCLPDTSNLSTVQYLSAQHCGRVIDLTCCAGRTSLHKIN